MSFAQVAADGVVIELAAAQTALAAGVGSVVAAGERARSLLDRRVLVGPIDPCGECDVCRCGGAAVCPLAVRRAPAAASTITAAARWLVPLGDGLELPVPAAAAVAGDVALAYTLYARTGIGPREPVVVVGESPIARFLIEILLAKGITPVAVAHSVPWVDWLTSKRVAAAHDRTALAAAFAAHSLGTRPWRMICADPAAAATAAELTGLRATLTLLAGPGAPPLAADILAREVAVLGVTAAHPDLVIEAAALCARGEVDLVGGITETADPLRTQLRTFG